MTIPETYQLVDHAKELLKKAATQLEQIEAEDIPEENGIKLEENLLSLNNAIAELNDIENHENTKTAEDKVQDPESGPIDGEQNDVG